jgi:hypothetical protein
MPASDAKQYYVSASRGKKCTVFYTHDKQALLEAVSKERVKISATELMKGEGIPTKQEVQKKRREMAVGYLQGALHKQALASEQSLEPEKNRSPARSLEVAPMIPQKAVTATKSEIPVLGKHTENLAKTRKIKAKSLLTQPVTPIKPITKTPFRRKNDGRERER